MLGLYSPERALTVPEQKDLKGAVKDLTKAYKRVLSWESHLSTYLNSKQLATRLARVRGEIEDLIAFAKSGDPEWLERRRV
jgi:hypothetical protein